MSSSDLLREVGNKSVAIEKEWLLAVTYEVWQGQNIITYKGALLRPGYTLLLCTPFVLPTASIRVLFHCLLCFIWQGRIWGHFLWIMANGFAATSIWHHSLTPTSSRLFVCYLKHVSAFTYCPRQHSLFFREHFRYAKPKLNKYFENYALHYRAIQWRKSSKTLLLHIYTNKHSVKDFREKCLHDSHELPCLLQIKKLWPHSRSWKTNRT